MTNPVEPLILPRPVNNITSKHEPADNVDDTIDIRGLISKLWAGKWIIAICLVIAYAIGYLSTSKIVPSYQADATVMFDIQQSNIVDLQGILSEERFDQGKLEDQMLILSSTKLIERVIDQLGLDQDPEFNPDLREYEPTLMDRISNKIKLPVAVTDILIDIGLMEPPLEPYEETEAERIAWEERLRVVIVSNVKDGLWLNPIGESRVLEIAYVSTDPRKAADIANAIANQYIVDQLQAKLEATQAATNWLTVRVEELRDRVEEAESKVEATRSALALEQGQSLEITEQQLAALNAALVRARSETTALTADYTRLRSALENPQALDTVSEFRTSSVISDIKRQETDLAAQVVALSASVSQDNPTLLLAKRQLEEIRKHINEQVLIEAEKIVAAAQNDLVAAQETEASLVAQVRELEQNALNHASKEVTLRQYEREAEASRVLYESLLGRLQETNAQRDLQSADARILSPAEVPLVALSQQQRRTMMLTVFLGGVAGVGIIFLLNSLNNTFRSPDQLEELSGETVLGTLPSVGKRMKRQPVLDNLRNKPNSLLAESVRSLRTSVLFSNVDNPPKVVMFTSSVPHEGKTTTAMLMAMTSRQMGKSAIIVDCDLRLPALGHMIDNDKDRPGLLSVIDGTTPILDAIYEEPTSGLHVLTTHTNERPGSINAADILSSKRFEQLIRGLSKAYDLVILDTPPTLLVTDARIVSKLVDAVVYAVRWDKTPRGAVLSGLKEMRTVEAPIAGLVMTMINEARAAKYSYDGYNYYKGRYRDYYGS